MTLGIESLKHRFPTAWRPGIALLTVGIALFAACNDADEPGNTPLGTESHFLMDCDSDSECGGGLSCLAGRCSIECDSDGQCVELTSASTCAGSGSSRSCDLACEQEDECSTLNASACTDGWCRQPVSDDPSPNLEPDTLSDGGPSSADGSTNAPDAAANAPDAAANALDAAVNTPPAACTQPASAYEVLGECTVDLDCEMFVDDCGCGCLPAMTTEPPDAGPPSDAGNEPIITEPDQACTTSDDCVLASRIDVCCPDCEQAFSLAEVVADDCLYAEGEEIPLYCSPPGECPNGCPGTGCAEAVAALCVGGTCRTAVDESMCEADTCDAGEYCIDLPSGYQCQSEDCEYDSCHPERCDQLGEACCDPLPGDGVTYCNGGLVCGAEGCQAPDGVAPNRICNNVLCAEGDVCCDKCTGACVDALSGAQCPNDNASDTVCSDTFPCGPALECSKSTQYCESFTADPELEPTYSCVALPEACLDEPNCPCLIAHSVEECTATPQGGYLVKTSAP